MNQQVTPNQIKQQKGDAPLVCLTAYTAPMAKALDPQVDIILVGDSLGMVVYGMESTLPVTLEMMVNHGKAVASHAKHACVVVDLPFGSYQGSHEQAFRAASRILAETGAQAVKLEGGEVMAETIRFLVERGVPVMAHIGLMPQQVRNMGGYKQQGKGTAAKQVLADAKAVAESGAFAVVIEAVPAALGEEITAAISIPTIGIGAGKCDGQVLVTEDMVGLHGERVPSFVTQYASLHQPLVDAVAQFADDVRARDFPSK